MYVFHFFILKKMISITLNQNYDECVFNFFLNKDETFTENPTDGNVTTGTFNLQVSFITNQKL